MAEQSRIRRFFSIAARSLVQHRLRSFLSISGVVAGVMLVLILLVLGEGARQELLRHVEQLGARNIMIRVDTAAAIGETALSLADMERLAAVVGSSVEIAAFRELSASLHGIPESVKAQIGSCSASYQDIAGIRLTRGRFISDEDVLQRRSVCVIGERLANLLGERGRIGAAVQIGGQPFVIIGIMARQADSNATLARPISFRDYNTLVLLPSGSEQAIVPGSMTTATYLRPPVSEIIVKAPDSAQVPAIAELVRNTMQRLHQNRGGYQVVAPLELLQQAEASRRMMRMFLGSIAALSLIIGGVGITNVMLASIAERTREIGIRRSLGATRANIMQQFLAEALLLTTVGGCIGIFTGLAAVWTIMPFTGWPIAVSAAALVMPFVMSLVIGVAAGTYPAYRASRLDPMEALRFT
jgi:putative ABC transport system permease protein